MSEGNAPNPYETLIADLRAKKEQEIKAVEEKYDQAIAAIELVMGSSPLGDVQGYRSRESGDIRINVGEFHGMPFTSAARAILQKTNRQPLKTEQIVRYIEASGRKIEAKNPAATVYSSLTRNPDFELVAPNTWGLAEWYGIKRKATKPGVAARAEEIMKAGPTSINDAAIIAEAEAEAEKN